MSTFFVSLKKLALLFMLLIIGGVMYAQNPENPDNPFFPGTSVEQVFNWYTGLYSGLLIVVTRLQATFFPNAGAIPKTATRYLLIAVVIGLLFFTLGFTNAWGTVVGFVISALAYDKVIEPASTLKGLKFLKTPTPVSSDSQ